MHLEHAEAEGATGLACQQSDHLVLPALEDVGGLEEDALPLGGRRLRPRREGRGRRVDRTRGVLAAARRHARHHVAGERIQVVERRTAGGVHPLAADELLRLADLLLDGGHADSFR